MQVRFVCVRCHQPSERHHAARPTMCFPCKAQHYDEGRFASAEVTKAIVRGDITRAREHTCVDCGGEARDWDHRDYTQPLAIEPVCRSCNLKRGKAFDSVYRPADGGPVVPFVSVDGRTLRRKQPRA